MSSIVVMGVDPGIHGAIAVIKGYTCVTEDLPTLSLLKTTKTKSGNFKKNNKLDIDEFFLQYRRLLKEYRPELIVIEEVHSMPKQGVAGVFAFGRTFGVIEAIIRTSGGVRVEYVSPQKWKKFHGLLKTGKDASIELCRRHYPTIRDTFTASKDGRAEAVLIAEYGRHLCLNQ